MQTTILMPEKERKRLDKIAERQERTRSQVIRIAIKKYLQEVEEENKNAITN